jgi:hypothetical protein
LPTDPELKARLLCAIAAKLDKLGHSDKAAVRFDEAEVLAKTLDEKRAAAVMKNITQGRERLGGRPVGAKPALNLPRPALRDVSPERPGASASMPSNPAATMPRAAMPTATATTSSSTAAAQPKTPQTRHILALVGTYEGKLAEPHLRAVARAAPLCWAFDLDLAFVAFPGTIDEVVKQASKSGIGEGAGYIERLQRAGRLHMIAGGDGEAKRLMELGHIIATTPQPMPGRSTDFATARKDAERFGHTRLVVLMGLGPKGIPANLLKDAPVHVELTGQNVSLETATAMGIIAERLRQV